jgi:hypothetical protein
MHKLGTCKLRKDLLIRVHISYHYYEIFVAKSSTGQHYIRKYYRSAVVLAHHDTLEMEIALIKGEIKGALFASLCTR